MRADIIGIARKEKESVTKIIATNSPKKPFKSFKTKMQKAAFFELSC